MGPREAVFFIKDASRSLNVSESYHVQRTGGFSFLGGCSAMVSTSACGAGNGGSTPLTYPMAKEVYPKSLLLPIQMSAFIQAAFWRARSDSPPDEYIPKPKTLDKTKHLKKEAISLFRKENGQIKQELSRRAEQFKNIDNMTNLQAADNATRSLFLEFQLREMGATYGDKSYNFCVSPVPVEKRAVQTIIEIAKKGYSIFENLSIQETQPDSYIEQYIKEQTRFLKPNGARVDVVLTPTGPKIIEVNVLWVDGFAATQALQTTYTGNVSSPSPSESLARVFTKEARKRALIINMVPGSGSRLTGPQGELEKLAELLTQNSLPAEVVEADKINPDYLDQFEAFIVNGKPNMIKTSAVPEWLKRVYSRARSATIFPIWKPYLDRKITLVEAAATAPDLFAPTVPLDQKSLESTRKKYSNIVAKGDGDSSASVFFSSQPGFDQAVQFLMQDYPNRGVIQPFLDPTPLPKTLVWNTSKNLPMVIKKPYCKFTVFITGGRTAGYFATLSPGPNINDRNYNFIPLLT